MSAYKTNCCVLSKWYYQFTWWHVLCLCFWSLGFDKSEVLSRVSALCSSSGSPRKHMFSSNKPKPGLGSCDSFCIFFFFNSVCCCISVSFVFEPFYNSKTGIFLFSIIIRVDLFYDQACKTSSWDLHAYVSTYTMQAFREKIWEVFQGILFWDFSIYASDSWPLGWTLLNSVEFL